MVVIYAGFILSLFQEDCADEVLGSETISNRAVLLPVSIHAHFHFQLNDVKPVSKLPACPPSINQRSQYPHLC